MAVRSRKAAEAGVALQDEGGEGPEVEDARPELPSVRSLVPATAIGIHQAALLSTDQLPPHPQEIL